MSIAYTSRKTLANDIQEHRKTFVTETISECITDTCAQCTGSYVNEPLGLRFVCLCHCGHMNQHHRQRQHNADPDEMPPTMCHDFGLEETDHGLCSPHSSSRNHVEKSFRGDEEGVKEKIV